MKKYIGGMDYEESKHEKSKKIQSKTNARAKALDKAKKDMVHLKPTGSYTGSHTGSEFEHGTVFSPHRKGKVIKYTDAFKISKEKF